MKILIVRTWPDQLNLNSYNVQEIGLAAAMIRAGHQCDIVFYLEKGKNYTEKRNDGITIYWRRGINLLRNGLFPGIREIAKQYDVIQVHEYDQIQSWLLYTFPRKLKVVIYHGPYFSTFNHGYNAKCSVFDRTFLKLSRRAQKRTICLTKSPLAKEFLENKGFSRVYSVGVGMNTAPFEQMALSSNRIADTMQQYQFNVIYVGKLEPRRNIPFLLTVAEKAIECHADIHFTIVGTGEEHYLERIMPLIDKLARTGQLHYWTKATQAELRNVYQNADLMLFPSNYEIYGMVLMEAMYFGVACISSMNGGAASLIENGTDGMILESFDTDQWVGAIDELRQDHNRLNVIKKNAETKIKTGYTWDRLVPEFTELYQKAQL